MMVTTAACYLKAILCRSKINKTLVRILEMQLSRKLEESWKEEKGLGRE